MVKGILIYEDESLLVAEKPAFTLSIPDRFSPEKENLLDLLREGREEVYTVHRLDRETSGIILFAKTREERGGFVPFECEGQRQRQEHAEGHDGQGAHKETHGISHSDFLGFGFNTSEFSAEVFGISPWQDVFHVGLLFPDHLKFHNACVDLDFFQKVVFVEIAVRPSSGIDLVVAGLPVRLD